MRPDDLRQQILSMWDKLTDYEFDGIQPPEAWARLRPEFNRYFEQHKPTGRRHLMSLARATLREMAARAPGQELRLIAAGACNSAVKYLLMSFMRTLGWEEQRTIHVEDAIVTTFYSDPPVGPYTQAPDGVAGIPSMRDQIRQHLSERYN
jgi:hypothetical protein